MTVRWRDLFDSLRVRWVDRGSSVSRGQIAIQCPWCGAADPSQHLTINPESGAYRCLRSPADHSGYSPYWLLRSLGVRSGEMNALLEDYGFTGPPRVVDYQSKSPSPFARRWETFHLAERDSEACDYLKSRGFWRPAVTARNFDLRVSSGRWAGRLWFPLVDDGGVVGFTGRTMRGQKPKYFTDAADAVLYTPRAAPRQQDKALILVEGPIDAAKLADALLDRYAVFVAALCGLAITPRKREQLVAIARLFPQLFVVLDSSVPLLAVNRLRQELGALVRGDGGGDYRGHRVRRLDLPPGIDDPGEMTYGDIEAWMKQTGLAAIAV